MLTENAIKVCEKRYLKKDEDGNIIETPDELFQRVAKYIAKAEKKEDQEKWNDIFLSMMTNLEFLPNTPTLINAGRDNGNGQLSACFVLPVEDNIEAIFDAIKWTAQVHKTGGGTGFSFSRLRPRNSSVSSTSGIASGPISFMSIFDSATNEMKQGGVRRGANMGVLRVDHPDILEFIDCKKEEGKFDNFNISIGITNKFMKALDADEDFILSHSKAPNKTRIVKAKDIWDKIVDGAWNNGEPGLIFLDTINENNPLKGLEPETEATNPCGEQPLIAFGSCNLGSINLVKILIMQLDGTYKIGWDKFKELIHQGVRFLDNVITMNKYPIPQIKDYAMEIRRIGLGIMGFADMLIMLGIDYKSDEAIEIAGVIGFFLKKESYKYSHNLYNEKGVDSKILEDLKRRNGALTTIAPTGSLSILANCSSGIEPNFDTEYNKVAVETTLKVSPPLFQKYIESGEKLPPYYVTTKDIPLEQQINIQAVFQKNICSGISKTLNAPNSTTKEQVSEIFQMAWNCGIKGVTFYREGSRILEALTAKKSGKKKFGRPIRLEGFTEMLKTGLGNIYITLNSYNKKPRETFITIGKAGNDLQAMCEAIGRLLSLIFKKEMCDPQEVIKQLKGIGGESTLWSEGKMVKSIPDAIGRFLESNLLKNGIIEQSNYLSCPDCQGRIVHQDGCPKCVNCGWNKCG